MAIYEELPPKTWAVQQLTKKGLMSWTDLHKAATTETNDLMRLLSLVGPIPNEILAKKRKNYCLWDNARRCISLAFNTRAIANGALYRENCNSQFERKTPFKDSDIEETLEIGSVLSLLSRYAKDLVEWGGTTAEDAEKYFDELIMARLPENANIEAAVRTVLDGDYPLPLSEKNEFALRQIIRLAATRPPKAMPV